MPFIRFSGSLARKSGVNIVNPYDEVLYRASQEREFEQFSIKLRVMDYIRKKGGVELQAAA